MSWITRWAVLLLVALLCNFAQAQDAAPPPPTEITLSNLRDLVEQIPPNTENEEDLKRLTALASTIAEQTQKFVQIRSERLADLNARLGELGPAPEAGSPSTEAPDITRQRAVLLRERNAVDADIRLARLLAVNAQQRHSDAMAQRRAHLEAQLLERGPSPLTATFWENTARQWPDDRAELRALSAQIRGGLAHAFGSERRLGTLAGLTTALILLILGNLLAERGLAVLAVRRFPAGRLRRSLLALLTVVANVLITGMAAELARQVLEGGAPWPEAAHHLAEMSVRFSMFLAFTVGLGRALLSNQQPPLRLPPMANPMAERMAPLPWLLAWVALVAWMPSALNEATEGTLNGAIINVLPTLIVLGVAVELFRRLRQPLATQQAGADALFIDRPQWLGLLIGAVVLVLAVSALLLFTGFLVLARTIATQLVWMSIVLGWAYLLLKFADDFWMAVLSSRNTIGQRFQKALGFAPQTMDQAAVLLSALSRVAIFFYMGIALFTPLGSSPDELLQRSAQWGAQLKVGEFELVPRAVFGALAVLAMGFMALRLFKRWLENSYLPNTRLEIGMRSSLITLLGYVGGVLVVAMALSALGIGVNRIAWVASALSVGIGFGLQAIVQNFISGLILLAERPVKVGDWVVLGTAEGDVRRINVRATEIQLGDRSTLVVPNSEFITKTVRNMTLANAEGRVLIRLPMLLSTDTRAVRDIMLGACREHPNVLTTPEPIVMLDGVENALLIFQAIAFVPSPRMAGGVRSDLLFTILQRLQAAQVPMPVYPAQPAPLPSPPPPATS